MKTQKFLMSLGVAVALMTIPALATEPASGFTKEATMEGSNSARTLKITERLEEIEVMDINSMSRTEKRALRKEMKELKNEMRQGDGAGVYISIGGGFLLFILLLIIIL